MKNLKGIGINYPIRFGQQGQTYYSIDNERVKLISLMRTIEGERFMQPEFGLNLYPYLFEQITPILADQIEDEIRRKVNFWIPGVKILDLIVDIESGVDKNNITVKISFGLKNYNADPNTLVFTY